MTRMAFYNPQDKTGGFSITKQNIKVTGPEDGHWRVFVDGKPIGRFPFKVKVKDVAKLLRKF